MPNNEHAQNTRKTQPRRYHRANVKQPPGGVRQDKSDPPFERIATTQPASPKKLTRARQFFTPQTTGKHTSSTKRKTVPLTLWVKPVVKAELQRLAEQEGLSISKTGSAFLEEAIRQKLHTQHAVLLQPIIEQAIRTQMRGISTRLAWLLVRVAFDSGQTRSIVTNILSRQQGVTPDILTHILDQSSKTAKANITRRTPQIAELIAAVERWIITEEGGKQSNA